LAQVSIYLYSHKALVHTTIKRNIW